MQINQIILIKIKKTNQTFIIIKLEYKINTQFIVGEFKVRIFWHSL